MNQLQRVLDALEDAGYHGSVITIVKQMMQAEPVAHQFYGSDFEWCNFDNDAHYQNTVEDRGWVVRALYTHPTPQAVPAGFVLVPLEPTQEMCIAARAVPEPVKPYPTHFHLIWDAMLAAAPKG
jgi:hypothetical protein